MSTCQRLDNRANIRKGGRASGDDKYGRELCAYKTFRLGVIYSISGVSIVYFL